MDVRSQVRSGFTLVELLVVVAIIAILIGLLLPAVQQVRQSAARASCQNKLHQIGVAAHHYHQVYAVLPPGVSVEGGKSPMPFVTWNARLLPYLEQEAVWRDIQSAYAQDKRFQVTPPHTYFRQPMSPFLCPSDTKASGLLVAGATNYFGVEGTDQTQKDGVLWLDSKVRFADIADGLSQTLLAGERPAAEKGSLGWWYAGEGQSKDGSADMVLGVRERNVSPYGAGCPAGPFTFHRGDQNSSCSYFHYWSLHPGGANFLFADGSVHFLSYSADSILPALATRAGGEVATLPD